MASCSDDKSWIVWKIGEKESKLIGKVENTHFRAIYSISWSPGSSQRNLIATTGSDNQIIIHEIAPQMLTEEESFAPKLIAKIPLAHSVDINCV